MTEHVPNYVLDNPEGDGRVLPSFNKPPVSEVMVSVQFSPLTNVRGAFLGLFWSQFRDELPTSRELAPLPAMFETFGGVPPQQTPSIDISAMFGQPYTRHLFEDAPQRFILQIQRDRFVLNWRKPPGSEDEYPRFKNIRAQFVQWFERFYRFVSENNLGEIVINQCEVSYVNTMTLPDGKNPHDRLDDFTPLVSTNRSEHGFDDFENATLRLQRILNVGEEKIGRIYLNFTPVFIPPEMFRAIQLEILVRGKPAGPSVSEALKFFDLAHEAIVLAFADATTPKMQKVWERTDA